jgi:hypothetical protein
LIRSLTLKQHSTSSLLVAHGWLVAGAPEAKQTRTDHWKWERLHEMADGRRDETSGPGPFVAPGAAGCKEKRVLSG